MQAQMILVAGPYRSGTNDDPTLIARNVQAMTEATLQLFRRGHLPVMGEWYALPLIEHAGSSGIGDPVFNEIFHPVARRLVTKCDGCLRIGGPSAGADEMVALARQHGKAVYFSLDEIPQLNPIQRPRNAHARYHAHVYFGPHTVDQARALCLEASQRFGVVMGRVHEKRVGPHPHWSCQLAFDSSVFDAFIAWLDENRNGLDVFVHGLTGDDLQDHTTHAYWLGNATPLNLDVFRRG